MYITFDAEDYDIDECILSLSDSEFSGITKAFCSREEEFAKAIIDSM